MDLEIKVLEDNNTWDIIALPSKQAIGYKWMYKAKYNSDETLERHKLKIGG